MQQPFNNFDEFPEADRFIVIDQPGFDDLPGFRVVYNWFAGVRDALQRAER